LRSFDCAAILFDLDGVLVDSTGSVERVWTAWALKHGLDPEPVVREAYGRRTVETVEVCAPHLDLASESEMVEGLEIDDSIGMHAVTGAAELIACLPPQRWTVVTSGTRALATARLSAAGLPMPATLVSADEVTRGKPDPEPYLKGAERLGFAAHECLVFEDTPAGISAAKRAGMRAIGLTTTYAENVLIAADATVTSFADVAVAVNGVLMSVRITRPAARMLRC
jgi:mannitol-1-/sugar-/sorbitol-6-phosphatase